MEYSKGFFSKDIILGQSFYVKDLFKLLHIGIDNDDNDEDSLQEFAIKNFAGFLVLFILVLIN